MVAVVVAPLASVPIAQLKFPPLRVHVPWLGVSPLLSACWGGVTVRLTPVAMSGPLLVTLTV